MERGTEVEKIVANQKLPEIPKLPAGEELFVFPIFYNSPNKFLLSLPKILQGKSIKNHLIFFATTTK